MATKPNLFTVLPYTEKSLPNPLLDYVSMIWQMHSFYLIQKRWPETDYIHLEWTRGYIYNFAPGPLSFLPFVPIQAKEI